MRLVNLGNVNALATRTPTMPLRPGRPMSTAKRIINATCIVRSGGIPFLLVTIKKGSPYRGTKGNDLSLHLVYNSNRTFMEVKDRKSSSDKLGSRLNSGTGKDSIANIVTKANANAVWSPHFIFSAYRPGAKDITFEASFGGPGAKFKGGKGR